jgi:Immunity protein 26
MVAVERILAVSVKSNLQILTPTRKMPRVGDIFVMQLLTGRFLFGRVILADLPRDRAPMPGSYLIYVYDVAADGKEPPIHQLSADRLLFSPLFINRLPWTKGYFENVGHADLKEADKLPVHCFRDTRGRYLDEQGRPLAHVAEPCGDWALASYRSLDDRISDALGIPRVAD